LDARELSIEGVFEISLVPKADQRGFFMRVYDVDEAKEAGIHREWAQENHSLSRQVGVIRGLHFQIPPYCESKLVRCVRGEILDVFVDLRKGSATFGRWGSIVLSPQRANMVLLPRGTAHGFCTIMPDSEVVYKVDSRYTPDAERTLLWSDPELAIKWPVEVPLTSEKDSRGMRFKEFTSTIGALEV